MLYRRRVTVPFLGVGTPGQQKGFVKIPKDAVLTVDDVLSRQSGLVTVYWDQRELFVFSEDLQDHTNPDAPLRAV